MHGFDFDELILRFRYPLLILLLGLVLVAFGAFVLKSNIFSPQTKIEILESSTEGQGKGEITAEISGAVIKAGVYKMQSGRGLVGCLGWIFGKC